MNTRGPDDEDLEDYIDGSLRNQDRRFGWHPGTIPRSSESDQKSIREARVPRDQRCRGPDNGWRAGSSPSRWPSYLWSNKGCPCPGKTCLTYTGCHRRRGHQAFLGTVEVGRRTCRKRIIEAENESQ